MFSRRNLLTSVCAALFAVPTYAQFTGPSVQGDQSTVSAAQSIRLGSYVTLRGNIVSHLREDYYLFRDQTGEIRVEIPLRRFGGRKVGPTDKVQIMGEVDKGRAGRYVWVKSLSTAK